MNEPKPGAQSAAHPALPRVPREKAHLGVRSWSAELEEYGFTVYHEGRGQIYTTVELGGHVVLYRAMGGGLYCFLLGVRAHRPTYVQMLAALKRAEGAMRGAGNVKGDRAAEDAFADVQLLVSAAIDKAEGRA